MKKKTYKLAYVLFKEEEEEIEAETIREAQEKLSDNLAMLNMHSDDFKLYVWFK